MILQGSNLIISANGSVLAASKSCSINVSAKTIEVSSPTDGQWENSITGRLSWTLETSHLIPSISANRTVIRASSTCWSDRPNGQVPEVSMTGVGTFRSTNSAGLHVYLIYKDTTWHVERLGIYNTRNVYSDIAQFISALNSSAPSGAIATSVCRAVVSCDSFLMTEAMRTAMASALNINADDIPLNIMHGSIAAIGSNISGAARGACFAYQGRDVGVHAMAHIVDDMLIVDYNPIRDAVARVGQTFDIRVQVDGYGSDRLVGKAHCKTFKVTATKGNLIQGSFSFQGTGPLT